MFLNENPCQATKNPLQGLVTDQDNSNINMSLFLGLWSIILKIIYGHKEAGTCETY